MAKKKTNDSSRTHRKEIQLSDEEYDMVRNRAFAAGLSEAAYIREASLNHEIKAALTPDEKKLYQHSTEISSRYLNNLNQLMRICNTFGYSQDAAMAVLQFVKNADAHLQGEQYESINTLALEQELKRIERIAEAQKEAEQKEGVQVSRLIEESDLLKEKLEESERMRYEAERNAAHNYLLTPKGENEYLREHNIRLFPNTTGDGWFLKVGDKAAQTIAGHLVKRWRAGEITVVDFHRLYLKNQLC